MKVMKVMKATSWSGSILTTFIMQLVKIFENSRLSNFLNDAFVVKSIGCSKWVMFFGTMTDSILLAERVSFTFCVD